MKEPKGSKSSARVSEAQQESRRPDPTDKILRSSAPPADGRAGRGWHIFSVAYAGLSLVMLAVLLVVYLRAA
ncbi:MAG: hypothetical protein R3D44_05170 [Hyphomicrobiaceae bacterium]